MVVEPVVVVKAEPLLVPTLVKAEVVMAVVVGAPDAPEAPPRTPPTMGVPLYPEMVVEPVVVVTTEPPSVV
jgi:hypothetical protein